MVDKDDLVALANFRMVLRKYLRFVELGAVEAGITPQQHQLLLAVEAHVGRNWATIGELSESLQLRHHAAVGLVDRCQAVGLVERAISTEDRRVVRVTLTAKGTEILYRLSERNLKELRGALIGLTADLEELTNQQRVESEDQID